MSPGAETFAAGFRCLTGHSPMLWQHRLFDRFMSGEIPPALDLPTGLGKTSVMAIWLLARVLPSDDVRPLLPRRLVYVVDRRAVVDQATAEALKLQEALSTSAAYLKERLGLESDEVLPISTLRGQFVDNRRWLDDPAMPSIIVGTVDMIGSRLLFEGYGVSRRMRPYQAGLLGADTLVVLDEAHLVPPFAGLLGAIAKDGSLWPTDRSCVPPFVVLPLSATQRARPPEGDGPDLFGLQDEDRQDPVAAPRLGARKHLQIEVLADKEHDRQLAEKALELATANGPARVVVFCDRRERKDDGVGPSAQGVAAAIEALAGDRRAGRAKVDIDSPVLLVGACRVHERNGVAQRLRELGFMDQAQPVARPAFLVATSAGEVGVDLDADHMVCDLVPWERMVQRLGRVNRRGGDGRAARVVVFDTAAIVKDEARRELLTVTRSLLARLGTEFGGSAGPATLLDFRNRVGADAIEKASTPEPLHPALTRPLVDAWSMTSLDSHAGRPEIGPWLRGWVEEQPQSTVIWRRHLPVRIGADGEAIIPARKEINDFFDAAPPHESEKLETETYRVAQWLHDRAAALPDLPRDAVVLLVLGRNGDYERHFTLDMLAQDLKGRAKEDFHRKLVGSLLVVDARLGGLNDGLLHRDKNDDGLETADATEDWSRKAGFKVRRETPADRSRDDDWGVEDEFILRTEEDDEPQEWLVVQHLKGNPQSEEGRSISKPQTLADHQAWTEERARKIAENLDLSDDATKALLLAARLHDEGKRADRWQRAFRAARDAKKCGLVGPLAKTRGPIDHAILGGYRHELGSLRVAETHAAITALSKDWRDLVLHLIAAHHGQARPAITISGGEEPPFVLDGCAREVALRFARLQAKWGPWGLAWWEALLRAADQQASRANDSREQG